MGTADTSPIGSPRRPVLAMHMPGSFTGARVLTFLPETLPEQLRRIINSFGLQPAVVQGGRLVEELSVPPRYLLELSVSLNELEGEMVLAEMIPDRAESLASPDWEVRSIENEEYL